MIWLLLFSCTGKVEKDQRLLLQSLGTEVFIATYQEVETKTQQLQQAIALFCADANNNDLSHIQQLWWEARGPWKKMEILKFGPYIEEPYRLGPKIDFWPVRPHTIDEMLNGDLELTAEAMRNYGTSSKGFPALEYLLYADHNQENPRYCEYLEAASNDLAFQTAEIRKAWDPDSGNYLANLTKPGEDKDFPSAEHALAEIVNRMGHTIANIRADKLRKPLGLDVGAVQQDKIESPYSHRSVQDILDNLEGIQSTYYGANNGLGISGYLNDNGINLDKDFQSQMDDCLAATEALNNQGHLAETLLVDPDGVLYLTDILGGLQEFIQIEILNSLSLWLTFNDSDGD